MIMRQNEARYYGDSYIYILLPSRVTLTPQRKSRLSTDLYRHARIDERYCRIISIVGISRLMVLEDIIAEY